MVVIGIEWDFMEILNIRCAIHIYIYIYLLYNGNIMGYMNELHNQQWIVWVYLKIWYNYV